MSPSTPSELKKLLLAEGFEVYRSSSDQIVLADRVRDNLIMDSGVAARVGAAPSVRFIVRAQASDFPADSTEEIFERARSMASEALTRDYQEVAANSVEVRDPGDSSQTLDVWHEVAFEKQLSTTDELIAELRYALALEKTAPNDSGAEPACVGSAQIALFRKITGPAVDRPLALSVVFAAPRWHRQVAASD